MKIDKRIYLQRIKEAVAYLKSYQDNAPTIGVILGSGLGDFANALVKPRCVLYKDIPNFPLSTVAGHSGSLIFGKIDKQAVVVMQGRFHLYEGYAISDVVFPIAVMQELGVQVLVITTASGGLNPNLRAGDLMLITDVLNLTFIEPLRSMWISEINPRPTKRQDQNASIRKVAEEMAMALGIRLQQGIFAWALGPNYESHAEIKMFRQFADAVSMSTVPEWVYANHVGMTTLGISCITNSAIAHAGETTHIEVITTAKRASKRLSKLLIKIIENL